MAVHGKTIQHDIRPEHFEAEGENLGVSAAQVRTWLAEMSDQLPEQARAIQQRMPYDSPIIERIVAEITSYTRRLTRQLRPRS